MRERGGVGVFAVQVSRDLESESCAAVRALTCKFDGCQLSRPFFGLSLTTSTFGVRSVEMAIKPLVRLPQISPTTSTHTGPAVSPQHHSLRVVWRWWKVVCWEEEGRRGGEPLTET